MRFWKNNTKCRQYSPNYKGAARLQKLKGALESTNQRKEKAKGSDTFDTFVGSAKADTPGN